MKDKFGVEFLSLTTPRSRAGVRESEVLRVILDISDEDLTRSVNLARKEILSWAQKRVGGKLPNKAWNGGSFEYFFGGRTCIGTYIASEDGHVWALRCDDPDKTVAGRVWTTEVTIGRLPDKSPRIGVRLIVSTSEDFPEVEPHAPGLLLQICRKCILSVDGQKIDISAKIVRSEADIDNLISLIESQTRVLPVIVASGDERSEEPDAPLINSNDIAKATFGMAHVFVIPAKFTYALSDYFGKMRSVYHGGVRVYMPGFDSESSPYGHPLFLSENLNSYDGVQRCAFSIKSLVAKQSLHRTKLGSDIIPFSTIRNACLKYENENQIRNGADQTVLLAAAEEQIRSLYQELSEAKDWQEQLISLHNDAEQRAIAAEIHSRSSEYRLQNLINRIKERGEAPDADIAIPASWDEFADWCDQNLIGRLVLAPSARRGVKKPEFSDISLTARCMLWLANECRDRRIAGGGALSEAVIEDGVKNSSCGGDSYDFEFRGRRLRADWHIKNGGNTRDPARCLRIYYTWDPEIQQVVVSDMPAHRRTGAS